MPRACLVSFSLLLPLLLAAGGSAKAEQGSGLVCAEQAEQGQKLRDEGKLVESRELFVRCAQPSCPSAVNKACAEWLDVVFSRIPTLVPGARDADGNDLAEVRVLVDGVPLIDGLAGAAVAVNPGPHVLRFERAGSLPVEQRIVAREGETLRRVTVILPPREQASSPVARTAEAPSPRPVAPGFPFPAYVTVAIGVAALGASAVFGAVGWAEYRRLDGRCAPTCPHGDVQRVRTEFTVASLALGAAAVAAAATIGFVLWERRTSHQALIVSPAEGGARMLFTRTF